MRNSTMKAIISITAAVLVLGALIGGIIPMEVSAAAVKLTASEISHLQFIREEEKLARDIYQLIYQRWGLKIFDKIAQSEQRHTDAAKEVLERFKASDPAKDTAPGIFKNADLQALYHALLLEAGKSSLDALKAGALTEEKDISDINLAVKGIVNEDLIELYSYLKDGSSTHLRGFMAQIGAAGGQYSPQFISREEFDRAMKAF
jgi:hypothetical protein